MKPYNNSHLDEKALLRIIAANTDAENAATSKNVTVAVGLPGFSTVPQYKAAIDTLQNGFFPAITPLLNQLSDLVTGRSVGTLPYGGQQAVSFTDNDGNSVSQTVGVFLYDVAVPFNPDFPGTPDFITSGYARVQGSGSVASCGLCTAENNYGDLTANTDYKLYFIPSGTTGQYYVVVQLTDGSDTIVNVGQPASFYDNPSWFAVTTQVANLGSTYPKLNGINGATVLTDLYTSFVSGLAAGCASDYIGYAVMGNDNLSSSGRTQAAIDLTTASTALATAIESVPAAIATIPTVYDENLFAYLMPAQTTTNTITTWTWYRWIQIMPIEGLINDASPIIKGAFGDTGGPITLQKADGSAFWVQDTGGNTCVTSSIDVNWVLCGSGGGSASGQMIVLNLVNSGMGVLGFYEDEAGTTPITEINQVSSVTAFASPFLFPLGDLGSEAVSIIGGNVVGNSDAILWGLQNVPNVTQVNSLAGVSLVTTDADGVLTPSPVGQVMPVGANVAISGTFTAQPGLATPFYVLFTIKEA